MFTGIICFGPDSDSFQPECIQLEAAKLACTSPPAMELLHVHTVFWCLLAWNHSQTFVDLLPLAEKTENVVFLCCFSHFSPPNTPFQPVKCATMPDKVMIIKTSFSHLLLANSYIVCFLGIVPKTSLNQVLSVAELMF